MDQSTLVEEQIYDGRRFVERFAADGNPVAAAFWARSEEDSRNPIEVQFTVDGEPKPVVVGLDEIASIC